MFQMATARGDATRRAQPENRSAAHFLQDWAALHYFKSKLDFA
jgi:hypothetical protein